MDQKYGVNVTIVKKGYCLNQMVFDMHLKLLKLMSVVNPWLLSLTAENELSLKTLCIWINGLLFCSGMLVIMSTTHGCVSQEHKTASFS